MPSHSRSRRGCLALFRPEGKRSREVRSTSSRLPPRTTVRGYSSGLLHSACRQEVGWHYQADRIADNSDDERRIRSAESQAAAEKRRPPVKRNLQVRYQFNYSEYSTGASFQRFLGGKIFFQCYRTIEKLEKKQHFICSND